MKTAALTLAVAATGSLAGVTAFEATIDGQQANLGNGTGSPVTGTLTGEYDSVANTFSFSYELVGDLLGDPSAPGAHLHNAPAGSNGPIVFPFDLDAWELSGSHTWTNMSTDHVEELFAGNIYINFHTTAWPGGEVRGQIVPGPGVAAGLGLLGLVAARRRR